MQSLLQKRHVLNFVIAGEARSGGSIVQTALHRHPQAACYAGLLHKDASWNRQAHEHAFGTILGTEALPDWYVDGFVSPHQYLKHRVMAGSHADGKRAVGVYLSYLDIQRLELYDLLEELYRAGDFCLVHVQRNPIACLVSYKQAEKSGTWQNLRSLPKAAAIPAPVSLAPEEVTTFVTRHLATMGKLRVCCPDSLVISYRQLFTSYRQAMQKVLEFLELPACSLSSNSIRLPNRSMADRLSNLAQLRWQLPVTLRPFLEDLCS